MNAPTRFDPLTDEAVLTKQEQSDALHIALVALLTRGRPAYGESKAKRIVDEAWGEMTSDELNVLTDAARDEANTHLTGSSTRIEQKARVYDVLMRLVLRYAKTCVDMDKAMANYLENAE